MSQLLHDYDNDENADNVQATAIPWFSLKKKKAELKNDTDNGMKAFLVKQNSSAVCAKFLFLHEKSFRS